MTSGERQCPMCRAVVRVDPYLQIAVCPSCDARFVAEVRMQPAKHAREPPPKLEAAIFAASTGASGILLAVSPEIGLAAWAVGIATTIALLALRRARLTKP